ncbi:MAG: hypothetical protein AUG80_14770 [Candidatus Rokubacteria bacterium 13_1_20CM_4_68_9]|nr:MAG: hypothetical protein AUH18_05615 [Candidatus Rokubacteria bacterium 13_2_20CM_69_10]OLD96139.1 MAG: hypothetical protein AUG80_14770 [Candidatus Rokubacteria bacterium 13_1_20CM_4_68_9]PYN62767.1 MAG: hypothetical protein DMD90_19395 [Candidatus Rokubacteria bacterium]
MIVEMLACDGFVGRVQPLHLAPSRAGGDQVGKVDGARLVVVRQMADLPAVRRDLDHGERGVRQRVDACARPRLGGGQAGDKDDRESERSGRSSHHGSPPPAVSRAAGRSQCREIDTAVDSGP